MLTVVPGEGSGHEEGGKDGSPSLIDEIVREGARRMLAEALQAEVDAYIAQFAGERDENGRRLVVRSTSHQSREVLTSAWPGHGVQAHRVRARPLARCERAPPRRPGPRSRDLHQRQTRRAVRREGPGRSRLKDLDPQVLTIARNTCRPGCTNIWHRGNKTRPLAQLWNRGMTCSFASSVSRATVMIVGEAVPTTRPW